MDEIIELLPVSLLDTERENITELRNLASRLKLEFGWHYLLDISWILNKIEQIADKTFIDAGAGIGVIQWYLADNGATVISIDRTSREDLPNRFRRRYAVSGLRPHDLSQRVNVPGNSARAMIGDWVDQLRHGAGQSSRRQGSDEPGNVIIYNQDLTDLADIADGTVDYVVAVSSLEHNAPDGLERVVAELMRVLKPGGILLATLCAAKDVDWYHEPSQGWCYSEHTLRKIFQVPDETPTNYDKYDQLFEDLKNNQELRENLASFYFQSGDNGMPWGKWNPEYQPVGVCKKKV